MNKELSLRIMLLLSALESWSFSVGARLPDHTYEELGDIVGILRKEVLK